MLVAQASDEFIVYAERHVLLNGQVHGDLQVLLKQQEQVYVLVIELLLARVQTALE